MGDLLQRISDHSRIQSFLTNQALGVLFLSFSFIILGIVLFIYDKLIFCVLILGSIIYGLWISIFLKKRKILDYELFEQQAKNQNRTYQFITSMQEIKLQDCEQRRRWEWEDTQADLFVIQMKALKLQQTQEAGSIFINEVKKYHNYRACCYSCNKRSHDTQGNARGSVYNRPTKFSHRSIYVIDLFFSRC